MKRYKLINLITTKKSEIKINKGSPIAVVDESGSVKNHLSPTDRTGFVEIRKGKKDDKSFGDKSENVNGDKSKEVAKQTTANARALFAIA